VPSARQLVAEAEPADRGASSTSAASGEALKRRALAREAADAGALDDAAVGEEEDDEQRQRAEGGPCRTVRLANFAQLVNAIAPIFTSPQGLFLQTIYHPLRLYAEHTLGAALDVRVDGPTYDLPSDGEPEGVGRVHHVADLGPSSLLGPAATCDPATGQLTVTVVNRDREPLGPRRVARDSPGLRT
jgi:hypothetical protein